jgi:TPP-dependent pyruvate/acetoin dehydrogenase alpha subunit
MASTITREQHHELYYYMRLNRDLEEQMVRLYRQNLIPGGLYSSLGQEAISVGTAYALGPGDWIAPLIRNIGSLLVRGYKPREILTQHMARYTSPTLGKDGTSHLGDLDKRHVVSPISMLGELIPVMTGIAMASRYLGQNNVAMTWIGDGGTSTGAFHEGLNLAAVQKAALVLIVENNLWAYSTPVARQALVADFADRAKAYGIASAIVDGNDLVAVVETTRAAVSRARSGGGPVLIEAKTMRMKGHAQHDPAEYVPKEMLEAWKKRDPLVRYEKFLAENKLLDAKTKKEIEARITREIAEDIEFAQNSPFPPPELAAQGVYCEGCHTVKAVWKRPKEEVTPPRSSVKPEWPAELLGEFGTAGKQSSKTMAASSGDGAHSPKPSADGAGREPAASQKSAKPKPAKKTRRAPSRAKAGR